MSGTPQAIPPVEEILNGDQWSSLSEKVLEDCVEVALLLKNAHFIVVTAGAGMSADSNLPVYTDIAKVTHFEKNDITYKELCNPNLLNRNPKLFWSFWGSCYNSYKDAAPHKGYRVLRRLRKKLDKAHKAALSGSEKARNQYAIHSRILNQLDAHDEVSRSPMFVLTSNVDSLFHKSGFARAQTREIHGCTESIQCAEPCSFETWKLRDEYRFTLPRDVYYDTEKPEDTTALDDVDFSPEDEYKFVKRRKTKCVQNMTSSPSTTTTTAAQVETAGTNHANSFSTGVLHSENHETSSVDVHEATSSLYTNGSNTSVTELPNQCDIVSTSQTLLDTKSIPVTQQRSTNQSTVTSIHSPPVTAQTMATQPVSECEPLPANQGIISDTQSGSVTQSVTTLRTSTPTVPRPKSRAKRRQSSRRQPTDSAIRLDDPAFRCKFCSRLARPNVLMFGVDKRWVSDPEGEDRFTMWKTALLETVRARPSTKVVILEIGVGSRMPTLANMGMDLLAELNSTAQNDVARLVRVNTECGVSSLVSAFDLQARALPALTYTYSLIQ
eukprot:472520_1